jgi:hypothetical protein
VMLNEHHDPPFSMGAAMDVEASLLGQDYQACKNHFVRQGKPTPVVSHPPRLAEELAMLDMISGGRLVWCRALSAARAASRYLTTPMDGRGGTLRTDAEVQACNCAIFVYSSEAPRICDAGIASGERHATARATSDLTRGTIIVLSWKLPAICR